MATCDKWPEVLKSRGNQDQTSALLNQHQDQTFVALNQHQNEVSILIDEDSSKIQIDMSEEEFFTITNSETQNPQNEFFQISENQLQNQTNSGASSRKSTSESNWMTPQSMGVRTPGTKKSPTKIVEEENRSSPSVIFDNYYPNNSTMNYSEGSLSPFSPSTLAQNPSFPLTSTGIIPIFPDRLMTTFDNTFSESNDYINTTYNQEEQTNDEQTDNNNSTPNHLPSVYNI